MRHFSRRSVREEKRKEIDGLLAKLEARSYKTYLSRVKAAERLALRHRAWSASVISASTATTVASVALLADASIYGMGGPTLLVCSSALTLIASLVTSSLNYSGRSRDMFLNYRRVQRLSAEVERIRSSRGTMSMSGVRRLNQRYDALLDESENHTQADYVRAFPNAGGGWTAKRESLVSALPYVSLLAPVGLLIPLAVWLGG